MKAGKFIGYKKDVIRCHLYDWNLIDNIECLYKIQLLEDYDPDEYISLDESMYLDKLAKEHIKSLDI